MTRATTTADPGELEKFEAMAAEWWDPEGKLKPLHMMNPCRLDYVTRQIASEFGRDLSMPRPLSGLRILDIGCGGGLVCEPMARLGATVIGADAAQGNIPVARAHAAMSGLDIDYRWTRAEVLAEAGERFDTVLNLEVVEHVADPKAFLRACGDLVSPGGLLITSTLNRTLKSFLLSIVGAEHLLRWLPVGTHQWDKMITPEELSACLQVAGFDPVDRQGFVFDPLTWSWSGSHRDLAVNYAITAVRRPLT